MADPIPISLGQRSNRSRHGHEGGSGLINCYAEDIGEEGKARYAIYAVDGDASFATLTGSGVRSMLALDNTSLYAVSGRSIDHVDASGTVTNIGGIIGDGLVTMARNRATTPQVGIVADGIFKIAEGTTLTDVTDPDLPPANSVCHLDGYFILTIPDGRFFITSINAGDEIDGLDFAKAEANPDGLIRGAIRNRDVCLFGGNSIEFWQNTGNADFPFERTTSTDVGCLSGASIANVDQTLAWVADDATVRLLNGYTGNVISTKEIERLIEDDASPSDISGFSWKRRGHIFYALSGTNWTRVFDVTTGRWHDRRSYGNTKWLRNQYAKFNGKHIFGDASGAALYEMKVDSETENGQPIVMEIETPPVHAYPYRMVHNALHVDVIPGVSLNTTDPHNADAKIILDYSEDGGHTWSAERQLSVGMLGQTKKRVVARRLGAANEDGRIYRLSMSADVIRGVMGMALDQERLEQ